MATVVLSVLITVITAYVLIGAYITQVLAQVLRETGDLEDDPVRLAYMVPYSVLTAPFDLATDLKDFVRRKWRD